MTINAAPDGRETRDADHLRLARERAHDQLVRLEAEYAAMLAEAGVLQEDRDNVRALLEAARRRYADAEAALDQVAAGTYGVCSGCGGPIGAERLEAIPGATTCVCCTTR
jgi:RNA polymerase-binding transcription factor DksA